MKTGILVTARLKSVRLPLKALKPIHGRPMIAHQLDRLRMSEIDRIVICTSTMSQDDPLEVLAREEGVGCYRGHPEDVLERLTYAATEFGFDRVFVCTADNPFIDHVSLDLLMHFLSAKRLDYAQMEGLPRGAFGWAASVPAMRHACEVKDTRDTEFWPAYFMKSGLFRWSVLPAEPSVRWPELRLTVDTPADFELTCRIFDELYQPGHVFGLSDIVELCRKSPELVQINAHVRQRQQKPIKLKSGVGSGRAASASP